MATEAVIDKEPVKEPQKPEVPAPTAAEIEVSRKAFVDGFLDGPTWTKKGYKKPEEKAIAAPVEVEEPKPDTAPADAPPKDPPDKPAPVAAPAAERKPVIVPKPIEPKADAAPADEPSHDSEIEAAVARRMSDMGFTEQQPAASGPQDRPVKLNPVEGHLLEVAAEMERSNPSKYEGLPARFTEFWQAEEGYRRQWLKDNPGEKWNPKAEDHKDFYETNEPSVQPREFSHAEKQVERRQIREEVRADVMREIEPEFQQVRMDKQMQRARPVIESAVNSAMVSVLAAVPEFSTAMDDGAGNFVLSTETERAMQAANPALHAIATEESDHVMTVVAELEKMNQFGQGYPINERTSMRLPNGQTIRPHAIIADTLSELEQAIAAAPKKDQTFGGKAFITVAERAERIAAIHRSKLTPEVTRAKISAIQNGHWTVEASDIKERIISRSRNRLTEMAKRIPTSAAKSKNGVVSKNGVTAAPADAQQPPAKPAASSGSDTVSSSDVVDSKLNPAKPTGNFANNVMSKWFGGP